MNLLQKYIIYPLTGVISLILYSLNVFICFVSLICVLGISIFVGTQKIKKIYYYLPMLWADISRKIFHLNKKMKIDVKFIGEQISLNSQDFYLVMANHQSWSDILVMAYVFNRKIPMLKFFAKKQLLWLPLIGQICWLYGFPFLHRHSQAELKKNPEWRKRDIMATKKACERFKESPGSLAIYAEGTRFSEKKRLLQQSPFQFLLKPKAGGLSIALSCMEDRIKTLLDVTIVYPKMNYYTFWDYCCGNIGKIMVFVKPLKIPENLRGDRESEPEYKLRFQKFINQQWQEKDELIRAYYNETKVKSS